MPTGDRPDPARATVIAILQQLNRAESQNEGVERDRALELGDLERRLADFWGVQKGGASLPVVLGLLLRNGLVRPQPPPGAPAVSARGGMRYRITPEGKQFLIEALVKADRIPASR